MRRGGRLRPAVLVGALLGWATAVWADGGRQLTVDAGPDQVVTLAQGAMLDGRTEATELVTVRWSVVSAPGSVEFSDEVAEDTRATFAVAGRYVLRLNASDGMNALGDDVTISVVGAGVPTAGVPTAADANVPPTVSAGADQTIGQTESAQLDASVVDDGRPGWTTTAWSLVGGPGTVTIPNPSALKTSARFAARGTYVLRITATDGAATVSDDVSVTVTTANARPRVSAGASGSVSLPSAAVVAGTASDDGVPESPGILSLGWSVVSGPGAATFQSPTTATTEVRFAVGGTYVLRLSASDGALTAHDDVTLVVAPPPASDRLLSAYGFDEGAGTTIPDRSGHELALTRHGATWVPSTRQGGAMAFDGVDDRVQGPPLTLPGTFTIMTWLLNPSAMPFETLVTVGTGRALKVVSEEIAFGTPEGDISFGRHAAGPGWHHVAVTSDGASLRAFVDGAPVGPPRPAILAAFTGPLQFGAWPLGAQVDFLGGALDDVRLYGRALSQAEIARDMATPIGAVDRVPDTDPPGVQLESPAEDATLSDVVTIAASATDDVGVSAVSFRVDGVVIGSAVTAPPYWVTWDTRSTTNDTHTITVEAGDTSGNVTRSTPVKVRVVNPRPPAANRPPTVSAGGDLSVVLPGPALLDGTVTDDGLPASPGAVTVTWQAVSGPGTPVFEQATEARTLTRFPVPGTYVLKLTVTDGALSATDEVTVTVTPRGPFQR